MNEAARRKFAARVFVIADSVRDGFILVFLVCGKGAKKRHDIIHICHVITLSFAEILIVLCTCIN